jgi:urease accessory protein
VRRAIKVLAAGAWEARRARASVVLDYEDRYRRRIQLHDSNGEAFLLDLARPTALRDGEGLELDDGSILRIVAADERVADVRAASASELARIAWHIGNRHTPLQILAENTLRIRDDHVLIEMVEGLGGRVVRCEAPFSPEAGAYAHGLTPGHSHPRLKGHHEH